MTVKVWQDSNNGCSLNTDMIMGSLKPGATLIYERANGVITAREFGSTEKRVIGYDVSSSPEQIHLSKWNDILRAAETNPALQEAIERVIEIYILTK
jgi:hypothetical protein